MPTKNKKKKSSIPQTEESALKFSDPPDVAYIPEDRADDQQIEVAADSLEASIGYNSLLRELQHAYIERVAFYRSRAGGALSPEEARAKAYHTCKDKDEAERLCNELMSFPIDSIDYNSLGELWPIAPKMAQRVWEMMKMEAMDEFESGHLASKALAPVHFMRTAWNVASYLGVRESLVEDWQPSGGMELMLIDMLAQAFLQYQYWLRESVMRTQTEPRQEAPEYTEWKKYKREQHKSMGWNPGYWDIPYVHEQEAVEHAAQMADRWNRIYMRTLRNLRDLRRYSPVTINNPQQVNIAADGGQQVNIADKQNELK